MATIAPRDPIATRHLPTGPEEALATLDAVRGRTLALVEHLSEDQLTRVLSPIMSPLVWDLAHIAAYEDLWLVHRHGGLTLLRPDLAELYDAFETPRSLRGEIELLGPAQAHAYLNDVRVRSAEALAARGVGDATIYELVLRHELQHTETMRQTMGLAGLLPEGEPHLEPRADARLPTKGAPDRRMAEWVEVPSGPFEMGAAPDGFAYDNERPRHTVELAAFEIARAPVSNASWMDFSEGGGYQRREWWSDDGWAWKLAEDIVQDPGVAAAHPDAPVCHVSWFEAEAFAAASGVRLPSEAEWEKAAALGSLAGIGQVWEWTSSGFDGYPGFVAHPYREYSEVFFGGDYRVLRGGSWATSPRVKTTTFRNWDHPLRRQIFAGVRLARDLA
ncbi:MAG TPA: SUMF1/EgtB/PvdO family nonheme iron enzyme [Solirubrobacteraceae bacterium]|jgi:iron(II)-dependent oxidoreductase|nr:SUMF1/EgtB/PvdO family nonheme iron enzyme [Solirubrobacteraceae bacterium]